MGFAMELVDAVTGETLDSDALHHVRGSIFRVGGDTELSLSITFNYCRHFRAALGDEEHLRSFDGQMAAATIAPLRRAMEALGDNVDDDYWKATEGNAKRALAGLLAFALMRPDGVWRYRP